MEENSLQKALMEKKEFVYTLELVPGRGSRGKAIDEILTLVQKAKEGKLIHAVTITDNAGGHPALFPNVLGREILQMGVEPIVHFTGKDKNRNQMESILYALDRIEVRNLLLMTGDYPHYGFEGQSKPVYDLDSAQLLQLVGQLNAGRCPDDKTAGAFKECSPTHFFKGAVVSPFKKTEAELAGQYGKLLKKVRLGADFIITQVGFDARKFDELIRFFRQQNIQAPVIGNVYILNRPVAKIMNTGGLPGCVVTDELYRRIEEESKAADKGKAARLVRGAKLIALLRGMGYQGVHIGGPNLKYEDVQFLVEKSGELAANWQEWAAEFSFPQKDGFYWFQQDPRTGLNTDEVQALDPPEGKSLGYRMMRFLHTFIFVPAAPMRKTADAFFRWIDKSGFEKLFTEMEYTTKWLTSRCRRCGDCTLPDVAFLCPQSQCAKYMLNGPCGGSVDGWCEVFPGERLCIYVRAYKRVKPYGEEKSWLDKYIRPRNWMLDQTSSWTNYFLGRDHCAPPPSLTPAQAGGPGGSEKKK
jgi:methylenetetrahydrofolate reductase (NADPH)